MPIKWWNAKNEDAHSSEDSQTEDVDAVEMPSALSPSPPARSAVQIDVPEAWDGAQRSSFQAAAQSLAQGESVSFPKFHADSLLAKAQSYDASVKDKRETAKKNAVIGMDALAAEKFGRMVDAAPDGEVLDHFARQAEAAAEAIAPQGGSVRQTAALAPAEAPGASPAAIDAAMSAVPTIIDANAIYAGRAKH